MLAVPDTDRDVELLTLLAVVDAGGLSLLSDLVDEDPGDEN